MKHKTAELEGALLDAAVAKAEGLPPCKLTQPTGDIRVGPCTVVPRDEWTRAMRAFVASRLGEEVELP